MSCVLLVNENVIFTVAKAKGFSRGYSFYPFRAKVTVIYVMLKLVSQETVAIMEGLPSRLLIDSICQPSVLDGNTLITSRSL